MSDNFKINDKYKDRLFRFIFGHEENKAYALDLYNALNNTDYRDVSELEFYTIEDVIYIKMKNDVALILDSYLMYNLNNGKNDVLRSKCKPLHEYMMLIERIRDKMKMIEDITKAIDAAVISCINDGILKDFLLAHRAEVVGMVLTEFDEKTFVESIRAEGKTEGANELAEATKRIKKGYSDEELLKEGYDPAIVKSANDLLAALS